MVESLLPLVLYLQHEVFDDVLCIINLLPDLIHLDLESFVLAVSSKTSRIHSSSFLSTLIYPSTSPKRAASCKTKLLNFSSKNEISIVFSQNKLLLLSLSPTVFPFATGRLQSSWVLSLTNLNLKVFRSFFLAFKISFFSFFHSDDDNNNNDSSIYIL